MFYRYILPLFLAPGVVVHELSHALFCVFSGVRVREMKLFGFGRTAGYVVHDEPEKFYQSFLVSIGPLLVNSLLALFAFAQIAAGRPLWLQILCVWLGLAFSLHAIPSDGDAGALLKTANRRVRKNPLIILGYPFVGLLYLLAFLKNTRLNFLYAIFLFWLGNIYLK